MDAPITDLSGTMSASAVAVPRRGWPDWLGVTASVACAIHCAAMPLVIGFLPLLGLGFLAEPSFHRWMVGVCLFLAVLAFWPGWRQHGRFAPVVLASFGLMLIGGAAFFVEDKCCPTLPESSNTTEAVAAADTDATCTASCCPAPEAEEGDVATAATVQADNGTALLWLTPAGSALLIMGHLVNRRCVASCCSP